MDAGHVVQLLAALGAGGILKALFDAFLAWAKGRQQEQRDVWARLDEESRARRKLEETLHQTRRKAMDAGVESSDLPPWPEYRNRL